MGAWQWQWSSGLRLHGVFCRREEGENARERYDHDSRRHFTLHLMFSFSLYFLDFFKQKN
jgi:hypothetical protein